VLICSVFPLASVGLLKSTFEIAGAGFVTVLLVSVGADSDSVVVW